MDLKEFIEKTWFLNRVTVGKDSEFTSKLIRKEYGGELHSFNSDQECLTWVIPKEWEVEEAFLIGPDGQKVADFKENPLYLCSYSVPFEGKISLTELRKHLYTNEQVPDTIPYHYQWQYQFGEKINWAFSLPFNVYKFLKEGNYEVKIKTRFKKGKMFINDIFVPGQNKNTIFFCAHICHPAMVNDGISNVAVALELLKYIRKSKKQKRKLKYSYRFIFGPEYFTGAAYLSCFGKNNLKYGFYLDMLGNNQTLAFSTSFLADSYIDKISEIVFRDFGKDYNRYEYRGLWGNDEMFYDGPGFSIPVVCIGRERFRNYHTSGDNLKNCNFNNLEEAKNLLIKITETLESDRKLEIKYKGPLYFSRYFKDIFERDITRNQLQRIQILLYNGLSYTEVSHQVGVNFRQVKEIGDLLLKLGLAREIK